MGTEEDMFKGIQNILNKITGQIFQNCEIDIDMQYGKHLQCQKYKTRK
jgi:hypothetical protein